MTVITKTRKVFLDARRCLACKACELACAVQHSQTQQLAGAIAESPRPRKRVLMRPLPGGRAIALRCLHCEEAPCVDACMSGGLRCNPETGVVEHDSDRCVGCWMCVMVCPFSAMIPNQEIKLAQKCDLCEGAQQQACVVACPTRALFVGTAQEFHRQLEDSPLSEELP